MSKRNRKDGLFVVLFEPERINQQRGPAEHDSAIFP
jgi:hypothetical protein